MKRTIHVEPDAETLLALWERGVGRPGAERDDALLEAASSGGAPRMLGERNAVLVRLHASLFGPELALCSRCPECGSTTQFDVDCEVLAAQIGVADTAPTHCVDFGAHRLEFRLPAAADIEAAASCDTHDEFALSLLERCVLRCTREGARVTVRELDSEVLDELSIRIEALDPGASVAFAVDCPTCTAQWSSRCDIGLALWQKVQAAAERVLLDVDTLARVYGWTESEVIRLSATRRAAYLQLAAA